MARCLRCGAGNEWIEQTATRTHKPSEVFEDTTKMAARTALSRGPSGPKGQSRRLVLEKGESENGLLPLLRPSGEH